MKAFVGLLIIMGILQLPCLEMYWQIDSDLLRTPGISSIMSRVQFEQIWWFLHLADNSQDKTDKLYKVRYLVDLVTKQFKDKYTLHQPVTIDEAMIPYKGQLAFQTMHEKQTYKMGHKSICIEWCYVYRLQIYTGKNLESTVDIGLCSRVLLELMTGLDKHHLYTDNYFTSPEVYLKLYDQGINCCGTVHTNRRGFPKELVEPKHDKPDRGYYDYLSNGPLLAAAWFDRWYVYFLSTLHVGASGKKTKSRWHINRCPLPSIITRLPAIHAWCGQERPTYWLLRTYNIGRRSKIWWKKVFS